MTTPILSYQRQFQVWEYTVSHRQLLLRSVQGKVHPTQVDVLFKSVTGMNLPATFQGLQVHSADLKEAAEMRLSKGSLGQLSRKFYKLTGDGWSGGILAGLMAWVEDQSDYHEPSKLMSGYWKGPTA